MSFIAHPMWLKVFSVLFPLHLSLAKSLRVMSILTTRQNVDTLDSLGTEPQVWLGARKLISTYLTGKSLSEALLFAEPGENMLCTKIVLNIRNNFCTNVLPRFELWIFMYWTCNSMNNLSSYCGLVDAKTRASDKDLPVNVVVI